MREHRDRTFMTSLVRILMNQLMQRGARRHRVKKQNHRHQQDSNERLAEPV